MLRLFLVAITLSVLGGCATVNPMAFSKTAKVVNTAKKSVLLMTIDVSRSDGSRYVPQPKVVFFEKPNAQSQADRQNFAMNEDTDAVKLHGRTIYLARMALRPGQYRLMGVSGIANAFPFFGNFFVPLLLDISVKPHSITYIGRVTAKLRDRKGDEFRAGSVIPLIDQSITGMSTSTWDVTVNDDHEEDLALYRSGYPVLARATIADQILPPFNRQLAQQWWANDGDLKQQQGAGKQKEEAVTQTSQAN